MTSKQELQVAYGLAIILLVVGILSYAAFPAKAPEEPIRMVFKNVAGNVLFDHKTHTVESGYGISCADCHHHPEDETGLRACGDCHHQTDEGAKEALKTCAECHEPEDIEGTEMQKRVDAFHSQCIDCHKQGDAGPQDCAGCHVM
ncbi:MAG TPA: cytochrome c3 family protein [Desulfobacterales bacterium]|nr:cytochrome c3 family protein [Desulfobacterales bacterium]